MESCGMSMIKYILFFFNLIFALSGVGIIVAGALVLCQVEDFSHFLQGSFYAPPVILIVVGAIVFIVAFLGCCGAIKENYFMLMAFAGLLLIIFVVELAVGIAAGVSKEEFTDALRKTLRESMNNYTNDPIERTAWDNVQKQLKCCGIDNPQDWNGVGDLQTGQLPPSCCVQNERSSQGGTSAQTAPTPCQASDNPQLVHQQGCYDKMKMLVKDGGKIIMGVGIGIAFVEIAGIVLACCLASAIKKQDDSMK